MEENMKKIKDWKKNNEIIKKTIRRNRKRR